MHPQKKTKSWNWSILDPHPLAYLITITCYGTHLHGHPDGSVHKRQHMFAAPALALSPRRVAFHRRRLKEPPYHLGQAERKVVMRAVREGCRRRDWTLIATHIRTNHLHGVVQARTLPGQIISAWKAYASRDLNRAGFDHTGRRRWTTGGSGKYLWYRDDVAAAVRYVIEGQGEPMEVYLNPECNLLDF